MLPSHASSLSRPGIPPLLLILLIATSCGPNPHFYNLIESRIAVGDFSSAHQLLEKNKSAYTKREKLLYSLDFGLLKHYAGEYKKSNNRLEKAERLSERLYTRSLTIEGASFLINDYILPYRGEDFERALIHLFMAINYLKMEKLEDALVEAKKLDSKLRALNDRYPSDKKNVYREDALIRFITGLIYEMNGQLDDAFIDYAHSEKIFRDYRRNYGTRLPNFVIENMLSAADGAGFDERIEKIRNQHPKIRFIPYSEKKHYAEVLVLQYRGRGPQKVSTFFPVPVDLDKGIILRVAVPTYQRRSRWEGGARISLVDTATGVKHSFETELMEDIEAIADRNLQNRLFRMQAKAIARVTAQYLLINAQTRKIRKEYGRDAAHLFRYTTSILANWVSNADIRSCRSFPAEIRVGRILVRPGTFTVKAFLPETSEVRHLGQVTLTANQKEFILFRTID